MKKITKGVLSLAVFVSMTTAIIAQEASQQEASQQELEENQLLVPVDLTIKKNDKYQRQELRIGGRLERVTVYWNNGVTEVYKNERNDTIWNASETELGEIQNVRQWRLGSW